MTYNPKEGNFKSRFVSEWISYAIGHNSVFIKEFESKYKYRESLDYAKIQVSILRKMRHSNEPEVMNDV